MIASYNISTPRVYQSHTNMIFTNTLISCFTIFDPSNFSSQPLAAQKSSWLQVVMAGDHGLRTGNCQLTHLGNMEFSRSTFIWWWSTHLVKIKILYITHTKNEDPSVPWRDPKSSLKTANLDLMRISPWNRGPHPKLPRSSGALARMLGTAATLWQ